MVARRVGGRDDEGEGVRGARWEDDHLERRSAADGSTVDDQARPGRNVDAPDLGAGPVRADGAVCVVRVTGVGITGVDVTGVQVACDEVSGADGVESAEQIGHVDTERSSGDGSTSGRGPSSGRERSSNRIVVIERPVSGSSTWTAVPNDHSSASSRTSVRVRTTRRLARSVDVSRAASSSIIRRRIAPGPRGTSSAQPAGRSTSHEVMIASTVDPSSAQPERSGSWCCGPWRSGLRSGSPVGGGPTMTSSSPGSGVKRRAAGSGVNDANGPGSRRR